MIRVTVANFQVSVWNSLGHEMISWKAKKTDIVSKAVKAALAACPGMRARGTEVLI